MTQSEMEQGFREIWKMFAETDKRLDQRFKETDERLDQRIKETDQRLDQMFKETDQRLDQNFKETNDQIKATDKKVHDLTDKWELFVEGLVVPAAKRMFQERGQSMEVDVLAAGSEYAVLIEVKSTLKVEDVNEHIERLRRFKEFFPWYSAAIAIGAVAGIVISEDADKYAYKQGMYVIAQSGDCVTILNDEQFRPKFW